MLAAVLAAVLSACQGLPLFCSIIVSYDSLSLQRLFFSRQLMHSIMDLISLSIARTFFE